VRRANGGTSRIGQTLQVLLALLVLWLVILSFEWGGWAGEALFCLAVILALVLAAVVLCRQIRTRYR